MSSPKPRHFRMKKIRSCWARFYYASGLSTLACCLKDDAISSYSSDEVKDGAIYDTSAPSKSAQTAQVCVAIGRERHLNTQRALIVSAEQTYEIRHDFPLPAVGHDEVMIRTEAVGLNPIDWKSVDYQFCLPEFPWVTGREMAGVVERVGAGVTSCKPGERVWTSTYYRDRRAGCFQEFVVVPKHTVSPIPARLSFEEAACLGVAGLTACMALWKWLQVPMSTNVESKSPQDGSEWLLIWGGSTVTGQFATQLASQANFKVITVNSQATKDISTGLGASYVVVRDGKSDDQIVEEIRRVTDARVTRAIDLVGPKTASVALRGVSKTEPVHFAPLAMARMDEQIPENVSVHTVEMKQFVLDPACEMYSQRLNQLIEAGHIVLPRLNVMQGGLEQIVPGLTALKRGNMGGKKLIVRF